MIRTVRILVVVIALFTAFTVKAQYSVSSIDKALTNEGKVDAVIRKDYGQFVVTGLSTATYKEKFVATIMNSKGNNLATVVKSYDKLSTVKFTQAFIYDAFGKTVYKLKKSDIIDQSSISGISVYEDGRIKVLDLSRTKYPYTIEYEVETQFDFLFYVPNWYAYHDKNIGVENSEYSISAPNELLPRFKNFNIPDASFTKTVSGDNTNLTWKFENLKPLDEMSGGQAMLDKLPVVYTSPSKFEYDGYQGDFSSWDDFAKWISDLNADRDDLPVALVEKMKALVKDAKSDKEKVRLVYDYLQQNTRYVSIQLGIGGYQPFLASEVDRLGYGDCKALSFYTKALLGAVDVDSKYTLVSAGRAPRPIIKDFPQSNFNHVILCVPNKGDTVWLECTSQTNPFGYLGSFTGDRDVLLIDGEKGKIVHTPIYDETKNLEANLLEISLNEDGSAIAEIETVLTALEYEKQGLSFVLEGTKTEQKEWVLDNSKLTNFNLLSHSVSLDKKSIPTASVKAKYELNRYARVSGKRVFFDLNPMAISMRTGKDPDSTSTKQTFEIYKGFTKVDTVAFSFPEKFSFEYVPKAMDLETQFGSYHSEIIQEQGKVMFIRKLIIKKGLYPKDEFLGYKVFIGMVNKSDKPKVVLSKVT